MYPLMKKRVKASLIDSFVASSISLVTEPLLRKKVKNEMVINVLVPTFLTWGLEYAQLRLNGQTLGQKAMGIAIESENGSGLTSEQILKRMIHRDSISSFGYLKDREKYAIYSGAKYPHDLYAGTVVKEK